ncbi:hypothetical protein [Streptomyces sp. NPDC001492]
MPAGTAATTNAPAEMSESLITWAAITLMTRRLTSRTARPAERRDTAPYYLAQAA